MSARYGGTQAHGNRRSARGRRRSTASRRRASRRSGRTSSGPGNHSGHGEGLRRSRDCRLNLTAKALIEREIGFPSASLLGPLLVIFPDLLALFYSRAYASGECAKIEAH